MLLAFMPTAGLAAQPEVGAFTKVEGRVDVLRDGAQAAATVKTGDAVYLGDIVRTKTGGRAEITFKDQSVLSIAPGSRLKIDQYVLNNDNTRKKAEVSLFRGKIRAVVTKAKEEVIPVSSISGSTFNINTPTAVAGIRGTDIFVFYNNGVTGVVFASGHGFVYNANAPGQVVNVSAGFATLITSHDAPPTKPRPASAREIRQLINDTAITSANGDNGGKGGGGGGDDAVFAYTSPDADNGGAPPSGGDTTTADMSGVVAVTDYDPELLGDTTAPVMTLAAAPASFTNQNSATFVITYNEPVTVTYTVNNVVVGSGSVTTQDTLNLLGLPEGPYSLNVTAVDAAGNKSTFSYGWTTDYTPPALSNTLAPPALTNSSTSPMGLASSEDPNTFYYYSFDGGVTWVQGSPNATPVMPEGAVTMDIKAVDRAGNQSLTTFTYTLTTDYTPPASLALTGQPAAITNLNAATIGATATDANGVSYSYTLDGAASTGALTGLTEGPHIFIATATDGAGNTSSTSYTWTTDYTPPASLAFTGTPAALTNINSATIGATATDANGVAYSYTLDGVASTGSLTGLSEGPHTFIAIATDGAGNTSTASYNWTTDYTPAVLSFTSTPAATSYTDTATFGTSSSETVTYTYTLDGVSVSVTSLTGLSLGGHTFTVIATDSAGNTSTISYGWTYALGDTTPPVISIAQVSAAPVASTATSDISATLSSNEPGTYSYSLDNGPWTATSSSLLLSGLAEGTHTIDYTATDLAGNTSAVASLSFDLSRYTLSGTAVLTSSGVQDIGTATGEIAGISNQNWGGYNIDLSGSWWEGGSSTFTL
ncbi:MAG: FecR domain-containing protein, partial [Deltaproteobacteria bacterium]|nr:FecR domain-containing protein [Deltaproteobacteria bacterium]